ncbi:hypothetical protein [Thiocapsa sp. UBA6158]|uniref:hypothetical protein n=1 Tax=Thiocapsa sp. UBA6158 TaxID=1947692 RepID=UPI0025E94727|nr:hypothetical protein [Thiocapsa sp. UBA6158]
MHPTILPFFETVQTDASRRVAVISLTQGTAKPYVVRDKGRDEIDVRARSTSRKASREQQAGLFALGACSTRSCCRCPERRFRISTWIDCTTVPGAQ